MMYKPPNREQVLANCAFLFMSEVEVITYHYAIPDPHHPSFLQRQYHALVLPKGFSGDWSAEGDINKCVLLRTSEPGLTSDAAITILADEIERQIGEVVKHGKKAVGLTPTPKVDIFATEVSLVQPPFIPTPISHEIQLAIEVEDDLALEQARFDAAVITHFEAHEAYEASRVREALVEDAMNPDDADPYYLFVEEQYHMDIHSAMDFERELSVESMCTGEQFHDDIIADYETHETELAHSHAESLRAYHCMCQRELDFKVYETEIFALEQAQMQDTKAHLEQEIIAGFEGWETELIQLCEANTRQPSTPPDTESVTTDAFTPDGTSSPLPRYTPEPSNWWEDWHNSSAVGTPPTKSGGTLKSEESREPANWWEGWHNPSAVGTPLTGSGGTLGSEESPVFNPAGTPQTGSEAMLKLEGSPMLTPRRSRTVNTWVEGQLARRENVQRKRAAVLGEDVSDANTMDISPGSPGLRGVGHPIKREKVEGSPSRIMWDKMRWSPQERRLRNRAREAGVRAARDFDRAREARLSAARDSDRGVDRPEPRDIFGEIRVKEEEEDEEIGMFVGETGRSQRRKLGKLNAKTTPTPPPAPAPRQVYPHLADLSAHTDGLQPTNHTSIKAWVNAAKLHWRNAKNHRENERLDSAYVDFLLAFTMIAEIIPCFPSFAAVRAAGSNSEVFVEFVELETELRRDLAPFMKVREDIKKNNKVSGVQSTAELGEGRGRGRGKEEVKSMGLMTGVSLSVTTEGGRGGRGRVLGCRVDC